MIRWCHTPIKEIEMSKGSPKVVVRLPGDLASQIAKAVKSANGSYGIDRYTVGSWIRKAICEKLNHLNRSHRKFMAEVDAIIAEHDFKDLKHGVIELGEDAIIDD